MEDDVKPPTDSFAAVSTADNEVPQYEIDEKTIEIAIEKGIVNEPSDLIITAGKYTDSGFLSTLTHILYVVKDSFYAVLIRRKRIQKKILLSNLIIQMMLLIS